MSRRVRIRIAASAAMVMNAAMPDLSAMMTFPIRGSTPTTFPTRLSTGISSETSALSPWSTTVPSPTETTRWKNGSSMPSILYPMTSPSPTSDKLRSTMTRLSAGIPGIS